MIHAWRTSDRFRHDPLAIEQRVSDWLTRLANVGLLLRCCDKVRPVKLTMLNRRHHPLLYRSIVVGILSLMRSAFRLLLVTIGSCAYAGLAVLGWGGFLSFFSHPAFVALVVVLLALSVVASFAGGNLSAGVREARGNRWVIPVFVIIGFLNAYLPAYTDRRDLWTIDGDTIRWVGVALFAAGGALRIWPVFVLGNRFSGLVAIQPGHTLVTSGVYRVIRHPSYLGLLINSLGWSLAFRSGVGVLLTALLILPLLARIKAEENLLYSQFGDDYNRYRSHTWRLMPGIY